MHSHAGGDEEGLSVATEVLGVDEVTVADAAGEFLAELVERLVALVTGRLDLDGPDLGATREDEIDLVVVVGSLGGPGVVEEFVARGGEHLRHDVLIDIAQIGRELVGEELLVDDVLGDVLVPEGEGDEKAGVAHIHLVLAVVGIERKSYVGIIDMMGEIDGKAVFEASEDLIEGVFVLAASEDAGDLIARGVLGELCRDGREEPRGLARGVDLDEIVEVELDNLTFLLVDIGEVVGVEIGVHGLWHTAYKHVKAEIAHELAADSIAQGLASKEGFAQKGHCGSVAHGPTELLVVQGIHGDAGFLAGDDDALGVLLDGEQ